MNKVIGFVKKHWIKVWLVAVLLIITGVVVSYAAYTEMSTIKRVVSTRESAGELFSSNCMRENISSRILTTSNEYSVTVCNYDQEKTLSYCPNDITYNFYAELQIKDGNEFRTIPQYLEIHSLSSEQSEKINSYSVCKLADDSGNEVSAADAEEHLFTSENGYTVSFIAESLAKNVSSTDKFKVKVAQSDLGVENPDFYILVWAERQDQTNYTIRSRIYGSSGSENATSWQGALRESDCETVDYDFYNYIITGNGAGYVDILWNADYFSINQFFLSELSGNTFEQDHVAPVTIASNDATYGTDYTGWHMISLRVGEEGSSSRYVLQLYKEKENTTYTGDDAASNYIDCHFRPSNVG